MTALEYREDAIGPCTVCGEESEGSFYWVGLTQKQRDILTPHVAHYFLPHLVQNPFFWPGIQKPFCGAICSSKYFEEKNHGQTS